MKERGHCDCYYHYHRHYCYYYYYYYYYYWQWQAMRYEQETETQERLTTGRPQRRLLAALVVVTLLWLLAGTATGWRRRTDELWTRLPAARMKRTAYRQRWAEHRSLEPTKRQQDDDAWTRCPLWAAQWRWTEANVGRATHG